MAEASQAAGSGDALSPQTSKSVRFFIDDDDSDDDVDLGHLEELVASEEEGAEAGEAADRSRCLKELFRSAVRRVIRSRNGGSGDGVSVRTVLPRAQRRFQTKVMHIKNAPEKEFLGWVLSSLTLMSRSSATLESLRGSVSKLPDPADRAALLEHVSTGLHNMKLSTARLCWADKIQPVREEIERKTSAYERIKSKWEVARLQYLQEVSELRDQGRQRENPELTLAHRSFFYDPIQSLSEVELEFASTVITEKLKMILESDANSPSASCVAQLDNMMNQVKDNRVVALEEAVQKKNSEIGELKKVVKQLEEHCAASARSSEQNKQEEQRPTANHQGLAAMMALERQCDALQEDLKSMEEHGDELRISLRNAQEELRATQEQTNNNEDTLRRSRADVARTRNLLKDSEARGNAAEQERDRLAELLASLQEERDQAMPSQLADATLVGKEFPPQLFGMIENPEQLESHIIEQANEELTSQAPEIEQGSESSSHDEHPSAHNGDEGGCHSHERHNASQVHVVCADDWEAQIWKLEKTLAKTQSEVNKTAEKHRKAVAECAMLRAHNVLLTRKLEAMKGNNAADDAAGQRPATLTDAVPPNLRVPNVLQNLLGGISRGGGKASQIRVVAEPGTNESRPATPTDHSVALQNELETLALRIGPERVERFITTLRDALGQAEIDKHGDGFVQGGVEANKMEELSATNEALVQGITEVQIQVTAVADSLQTAAQASGEVSAAIETLHRIGSTNVVEEAREKAWLRCCAIAERLHNAPKSERVVQKSSKLALQACERLRPRIVFDPSSSEGLEAMAAFADQPLRPGSIVDHTRVFEPPPLAEISSLGRDGGRSPVSTLSRSRLRRRPSLPQNLEDDATPSGRRSAASGAAGSVVLDADAGDCTQATGNVVRGSPASPTPGQRQAVICKGRVNLGRAPGSGPDGVQSLLPCISGPKSNHASSSESPSTSDGPRSRGCETPRIGRAFLGSGRTSGTVYPKGMEVSPRTLRASSVEPGGGQISSDSARAATADLGDKSTPLPLTASPRRASKAVRPTPALRGERAPPAQEAPAAERFRKP